MGSGYIETGLSQEVVAVHRALASLQEELEAIDYYHQRADLTEDAQLKAILAHNRDDEMEHAAMLLEWLRRALPEFDGQLRKLLFTSGCIVQTAKSEPAAEADGVGLGLGCLK